MRRFLPRPTYANAMSTIAVFLVLGSGAYAAVSSIPGPDGVIHGCFKKKGGSLRLVAAGRKCSKGERAVVFNQQGRSGFQGTAGSRGVPGAKGERGPQGPGATSFQTNIESGGSTTLASLPNGVTVGGSCGFGIRISVAGTGTDLQASGTGSADSTVQAVDINGGGTFTEPGANNVDLDVIARAGAAQFARIDVHGSVGAPCVYWGTVTPSS